MARQHDLAPDEVRAANGGHGDRIGAGEELLLPTFHLVPDRLRPGLLIVNLSERRLYYRDADHSTTYTFPVGVGKRSTPTPTGSYRVLAKIAAPSWHVPRSIRREDAHLPAVVPPGPRNPLGTHALRLTDDGLMIHGTNAPASVGGEVSHGCLRMLPEDIKVLFRLLPQATPVEVRREPVKIAEADGRVYLEVHRDRRAGKDPAGQVARILEERGLTAKVSAPAIAGALERSDGVPVDITLEQRTTVPQESH